MTQRIEPGTLVDERYRVLYRVGSGGMADVYCAEDIQLGRRIALKVLYQRFAEDAEFVERFRREASSAAGLQHPNVVSVYDRGAFDGTYYIAMEYLEGRSLKQVIIDEAPLDQARAIDLTDQILRAARFAHKRGIIHRDLKPQNVIVDEEGRAKVTDFGIARAGASDMTETGSIMGTAQYLSPEQAQGHAVGPTSDLYAIGIILYELLTGRLPFEGESAVSIALKQVSEPPLPPSQIVAGISPELEYVNLTALAKDPAARYQDADQFMAALEQARLNLARAGDPNTQGYVAVAPMAPLVPYEPESAEEIAARKRKRLIIIGAIAAFLLLAGVAFAAFSANKNTQVVVPDVVGATQASAQRALENAGFSTDTTSQTSKQPAGNVIGQNPDGGTQADKGATVTLTISSGPAQATVPPVSGEGRNAATSELEKLGFVVRQVMRTDQTVALNHVISSSPDAGAKADVGSTVTLYVSSGVAQVTVPAVVNQNIDDARSQLQAVGFVVATVQQTTQTQDPGTVLAQSPTATTKAGKGSTVTLTVAKAPTSVAVPDVVGRSEGTATNTLEGAGFTVNVTTEDVDTQKQDGIVQSQTPGGGGKAKPGSSVTIVVGKTGQVPTTPTTTPTTPTTPGP